jgi:cob(I)alamin adenosyltransferase
VKIYTKRGDEGETDLFGGGRVPKNHVRVRAYGEIDCANTAIGLAYSTPGVSDGIKHDLVYVMQLLFCAGAEIATAPKQSAHLLLEKHLKNAIEESHILWLERAIDEREALLTPLKSFILPCGTDAASRLHWARNSVRQAEIMLMDLKDTGEEVRPQILKFFNRLSDFLFVLARVANAEAKVPDITWSGSISQAHAD